LAGENELEREREMDFQTIIYEAKDQIAWITLNRPEVMNAINQEMAGEIVSACRQAEGDKEVRVVIFKGAGERAFSAGADLKQRAQGAQDASSSIIERRQVKLSPGMNTQTLAVAAIAKPTIALVRGYAVGGGLEICMACDIRVVAEDAKMGLPEVRHGIMPGSGGTQRLTRIVGLAKALEICLTGELIDAKEAYRIGLVHRLVSPEELLPVGEKIALAMMKGAPLSLRFTKEAIYVGSELPLEQALRLEADLSALVATTEDSKEGPRAFVEKRAPIWKGR
jgi:enoyl-CoA hydratase